MCDLILGETKFAGVGCEVIAAYNYLKYEGFEPDMAKLAYDLKECSYCGGRVAGV